MIPYRGLPDLECASKCSDIVKKKYGELRTDFEVNKAVRWFLWVRSGSKMSSLKWRRRSQFATDE
jgi:hypothetical protein